MWRRRNNSFRGVYLPQEAVKVFNIEYLPAPKKAILPMEQHEGGVCTPTVSKGETVKIGQMIGSHTDFSVAPVHSSISGTVTDIKLWPEPHGSKVLSVVVESDGKEEWVETAEEDDNFLYERPSRLLGALRHAGIIEIGLKGQPLHIKLSPPERPKSYLFLVGIPVLKKVDTLLINAVDLEPYVFVRRAVLHSFTDELILGIQAVKRIVGVDKVALAVSEDEGMPEEMYRAFQRAGIRVFWVSSKYPSAFEPLLVKQFTGKEIPLPDGTSRDVGVLVQDVVTVINVLTAVRDRKPQIDKLITVSGYGLYRPRNVVVRIGTPVGEVLSLLGIDQEGIRKVVMGGPMTGYAQYTLDVPVTKETYAIYLQDQESVEEFRPDPCFNCGECVQVCPVNLLPNELSKYCEFGRFDDAERGKIFHCIECGLCAYVCPVKRPMVHFMRYGKAEIVARKVGE